MHKNNNSDMKKEQISDGKKPELQCEICEAYFSAKTSLNRHIASCHDKQILYSCEICNSKFAQKGNLKDTQHQFMKGKSLSNVTFVTTIALRRIT